MTRRHDLDWLRVLLFGLLVPHHVAVGFVDWGEDIYGFVNDRLAGPGLGLAIYWSHSWRLPALFLIAGIGTWFATARGAGAGFMGQRVARLLVPATFGALILNAPAGFAMSRMTGGTESLMAFLADWVGSPELPQVMHLWFLVNLAIYTLLCWPLLAFRNRLSGWQMAPHRLVAACVALITLTIMVAMPHGAAIAGDGYQFPWYLTIFASGYVLGARHEPVLAWAARRRFLLLTLALVAFLAKITLLDSALETSPPYGAALAEGGWSQAGLAPAYGFFTLSFAAGKGLNACLWCLAALGFAARHLNRASPLLATLTASVFPFYVLHFPLTIVVLALFAHTGWPWGMEFLFATALVYGLTWGAWRGAARLGPAAWLVGGRLARPMAA